MLKLRNVRPSVTTDSSFRFRLDYLFLCYENSSSSTVCSALCKTDRVNDFSCCADVFLCKILFTASIHATQTYRAISSLLFWILLFVSKYGFLTTTSGMRIKHVFDVVCFQLASEQTNRHIQQTIRHIDYVNFGLKPNNPPEEIGNK